MVIGALALSPFLPSALQQAAVAAPEGLGAAIYLGTIPSLVAYGSWAVALSRLPASRATNFLFCVPPVATLIGYVWLGEVPGVASIVGGLLALGGVVIVNLKRQPQRTDVFSTRFSAISSARPTQAARRFFVT